MVDTSPAYRRENKLKVYKIIQKPISGDLRPDIMMDCVKRINKALQNKTIFDTYRFFGLVRIEPNSFTRGDFNVLILSYTH